MLPSTPSAVQLQMGTARMLPNQQTAARQVVRKPYIRRSLPYGIRPRQGSQLRLSAGPSTKQALRNRTKGDLLMECETRGLSSDGNKKDLIERLYTADRDQGAAARRQEDTPTDAAAATQAPEVSSVTTSSAASALAAPGDKAPQQQFPRQLQDQDKLGVGVAQDPDPQESPTGTAADEAEPEPAQQLPPAAAVEERAVPSAAAWTLSLPADFSMSNTASQLDEAIDMLGVKITSKPRTKAARMELLRAFAVQHAAAGTANSSSISVDGIAIAADAIPVTLLNIQHQQQEDGTLPSQLPAAAADSPPAADSSSSSSSPAATQLPPGAAAPEEEVSSHPSMVLNEKHLNPEHLRNLTKKTLALRLADLGLSHTGSKQALEERLFEHATALKAGTWQPPAAALADPQPLYIFTEYGNSKAELLEAAAQVGLEVPYGGTLPKMQPFGQLWEYAVANQVAAGEPRSNIAVGGMIIKAGVPVPSPPGGLAFKPYTAYTKDDLDIVAEAVGLPYRANKAMQWRALLRTAKNPPYDEKYPLLAAFIAASPREEPADYPATMADEIDDLLRETRISKAELREAEAAVVGEPSEGELQAIEGGGGSAGSFSRGSPLQLQEDEGRPFQEEGTFRGVGGDLEFDTQRPGVKQRSENVSAKAGSAIPNESDPDQSTADLTLSAGPLDDLPITMNPNDPDPTKADAPVDRLDQEAGEEPDNEELEAEDAAMLAEEQRAFADFDADASDDEGGNSGPRERGTTRQAESMSYAGDSARMMQQEGFQDDDEDGLIAELEGMDTRASDLAADDLSRSQSQAQLGDEGFAFEDEDMSADLDDSDGEDFPTSDALPAPGGLYQEQTELQAGDDSSPAADESSAEAESSPGATLRNPSRLELMGLADRGARKEADGAPSGGQEQWEGSEKPTVADLDAMGWFDEAAENFEGPAGLPAWMQDGPAASRKGAAEPSWNDTEDSDGSKQQSSGRYAGYYNPLLSTASMEDDEEPPVELPIPSPQQAAAALEADGGFQPSKRRRRRSRRKPAMGPDPQVSYPLEQEPRQVKPDVAKGVQDALSFTSARANVGTDESAAASLPADMQQLLQSQESASPDASPPITSNTQAEGDASHESSGLLSRRPAPAANTEAAGTPAQHPPAAAPSSSTSSAPAEVPELDSLSPAVQAGQISSITPQTPLQPPATAEGPPVEEPTVINPQPDVAVRTQLPPTVQAGQISSIVVPGSNPPAPADTLSDQEPQAASWWSNPALDTLRKDASSADEPPPSQAAAQTTEAVIPPAEVQTVADPLSSMTVTKELSDSSSPVQPEELDASLSSTLPDSDAEIDSVPELIAENHIIPELPVADIIVESPAPESAAAESPATPPEELIPDSSGQAPADVVGSSTLSQEAERSFLPVQPEELDAPADPLSSITVKNELSDSSLPVQPSPADAIIPELPAADIIAESPAPESAVAESPAIPPEELIPDSSAQAPADVLGSSTLSQEAESSFSPVQPEELDAPVSPATSVSVPDSGEDSASEGSADKSAQDPLAELLADGLVQSTPTDTSEEAVMMDPSAPSVSISAADVQQDRTQQQQDVAELPESREQLQAELPQGLVISEEVATAETQLPRPPEEALQYSPAQLDAVTDGELAPTDESAAASSSTADSAAADSLTDESAAASSLTEQSGGFSSLTAESAGSVTPVQQDLELLSRPPAGTPPGLVQGVEEEARDVLQLRAQVREKQQKLAALQQQVQGQAEQPWPDAMRLHIQVETLRAEREALAREAKAGNLADLRSAASRSRVEAGVKTVLQQTMGRVEAELAGLDADVIECDKAAARLHRELAKAREKWAPPGGTPADPQWDSAVTDQPETTTATAVISRRTNGAHLPSLGGVKPSEIPEGFLYEAVDVPEQALVGRKAGKSQVSPGLLAAATVMGAYKAAQSFWGGLGKRKSPKPQPPQSFRSVPAESPPSAADSEQDAAE